MDQLPVIDMAAAGSNILCLRLHAGYSVKYVQNLFVFSSPQAVYKWQRGSSLPTVDKLAVLAAMFGVKIDDILILQSRGASRSA